MKHFLMSSSTLRAPENGGGGGGGGSDDGGLSGDALKGTPFEGIEGAKIPGSFVKEGKLDFAGLLGAATRPDPFHGVEVPEKFVKDGKVQVGDLLKSYSEAEKGQMRRREELATEVRSQIDEERAKAAPAAPGDYKAPEPWKMGEGDAAREYRIDTADPMFAYFQQIAHSMKMPQADFEAATKGYVQAMTAALPDWNVESKTLGVHAEKRLERVDGFLKGNLSKENYAFFSSQPATARMIQAIEEVMTLAGHPPIVGDTDDVPDETYTHSQLKEMQRDPRYTGDKGKIDPAFVAKVRAGFQRLSKKAA